MNPKMSNLLIALVLVSLCAGVFTITMVGFNVGYARSDFDSSSMESLNKLTELQVETEKARNGTNIEVSPGITDIIGGYFSSAYKALRLSISSVDIFEDMGNIAMEKSSTFFPNSGIFKTALITIVLILVFIGIFISTMAKRET